MIWEQALALGGAVGTVGRPEQEAGAWGREGGAEGEGLGGRAGIAEDAGAGRQGRGQDLCARGQAGGPGPRALAGPRRAPAIEREAGDPGGGFPWP